MSDDLHLRRKWTLHAHGQRVIFIKKVGESAEYVLMKALLWALYLPQYPDMRVEVRVGDRYKPDLVALGEDDLPRFWAEAGQVGKQKIHKLVRLYRATHFVIARWEQHLDPLETIVREALAGVRRDAPFDLISFPADSAQRFIDARGTITLAPADITRVRIQP